VTGLVLLVALMKADSKDVPVIIKILFGSDTFAVVGWTLALVFFAWRCDLHPVTRSCASEGNLSLGE